MKPMKFSFFLVFIIMYMFESQLRASEDLKWSSSSSFDVVKKVPSSEYVEIDMHRALYLDSNTKGKITKIEQSDPNQCKKIMIKDEDVILKDPTTLNDINIGKKTLIVVFEPKCVLFLKKEDLNYFSNLQISHKFSRNLNVMSVSENVLKPSDNKELGGFINADIPIADIAVEDNVIIDLIRPNKFFPYATYSHEFVREKYKEECYDMCKFGRIFEFELRNGLEFANTFYLKAECKWMSIHLNKDEMSRSIEISLYHGFVTLPRELRAYPIDFENVGKTPGTSYEVIFSYYKEMNGEGYDSYIIIANRHGRIIRRKLDESTKNIFFAFSSDNCLAEYIGSKTREYKDFEFDNNMNIGFMVAQVQEYKAYRYTSESDPETNYNQKKYEPTFTPPDKPANPLGPENPTGYPTTVPPPNAKSVATLPTPPVFTMSPNNIAILNNINIKKAKMDNLASKILKNPGFYYWAIPAGFSAGSFVSFLIANIILFVFKRTVLTFWYKAMYKRYGSDTTMGAGTTMGKTAAGETIGSTTVGGGTTMGGTTAGETGSTTAA